MKNSLESIPLTLRRHTAGFSLIELLTVLAIMGLLMASITPALQSSQRASFLTQAGNRLADLITTAKQTSLSRNVMTAVILVTSTSDATWNGRVLGLLEMGSDHTWKQAGAWIYLPETVQAQDVNGASPYNALPVPADAGPARILPLKGDANPVFTALVFYPDGRMRGGTAPARKISVRFHNDALNPAPANYYDLVFNAETSTLRIRRP